MEIRLAPSIKKERCVTRGWLALKRLKVFLAIPRVRWGAGELGKRMCDMHKWNVTDMLKPLSWAVEMSDRDVYDMTGEENTAFFSLGVVVL